MDSNINSRFTSSALEDAPELSAAPRRSSSDIDLAVEKTLLVNPKCPVRIMLEYIRKKCRLGSFTTFDLCDESGYLKGLFSLPTYAYATDLFCHKKTYYVIVVKQESEKLLSIFPQVNHENPIYLHLKDRCMRYLLTGDLSPMSTPQVTPPGKMTPPPPSKAALKKK